MDVTQVVQVLGSLLILIPFMLVQFGLVVPQGITYILSNLAGSAVLAVQAAQGRQWGFLLLEFVWASVSLVSMVGVIRTRSADRRVRSGPSTFA